jgi:NAD(P)-dependent dehydrogenase (short-subunit alcohol dehydrogenase family)
MHKADKTEVVVVTGASAGVGRATTRAFARQKARIGLLGRGRDGLEAARQEVEALGGQALVLPTDVADAEQVEAAAAAVEAAFGPPDIWVNNAMVSVFSPIKEMTPDEFRRVTEVTYLGVVYGTLCALLRMLPRNQGTIVQVGSALAYRGIPLQAAYCGAKHAIQGFTDSLHAELIHDDSNVHVTMVQLPALNTPQFGWVKSRLPNKAQPVPPIFQPEVAAEAIVWAAHHRRRELTVGGMNTIIVWGNKFLPGVGDWYLAKTGYDAQQTDEPRNPNQPHNLWEPVPGDHGAHGAFDAGAQDHSWQLWANMHLNGMALAALGVLGAAVYAWLSDRNQETQGRRPQGASFIPQDRQMLLRQS